ncbi:hemicentin-1-like [Tubulanus polymorphus]|uniref:hemicentin-1-like n=1 Tax=Tubulanus polymorphus TaxID=672921 RepID=UPI003DA50EEB
MAFVFDVTGSMYDDLLQVIEGAAKILRTTLARRDKPLYNYVLVPFHDPEIGPVTVTTDPDEFQEELRNLYVQGGGDCPEMSVGAIRLALQVSLPNSFVYVFTDARSKDFYLTEQVLTLIQKKQSQVVFVMTGDCGNTSAPGFKAYETIAATSSGQVFLLKKSQVNQVLNFVEVAVQSRKVNVLSVDLKSGRESIELPIDSKLPNITVSLSGELPQVILVDPKGKRYTAGNGLDTLLKLKKALIVSINDPKPGLWKLIVESSSPHSLRVTGLSTLDFVHGFSRKPTLNLNETDHRPVQGIPTYVVLNSTDLKPPGRFTKLTLVDLYGKSLIEVPIVQDPSRPHLYNVSSFMPPAEGFFFLKVEGVDELGYRFQRKTPTALSADLPAPPLVRMPAITHGYYDATATIKCNVDSLIPFAVQWFRDSNPEGQLLYFRETAVATLEVPSASIFSEGVYMCNATSIMGTGIAQTFLDIKDPPPSILVPFNVSVTPGRNALLSCIAYSSVDYNMTWYRDGSNIDLTLDPKVTVFSNGSMLIENVEISDEGKYNCRAANEGGFNEETIHVFINRSPTVKIYPQVQSFVVGTKKNVTYHCSATGFPEPLFSWMRDGQVISNSDKLSFTKEGVLTITDLKREDAGQYECIATNPAGEDTEVAILEYWEPPRVKLVKKQYLFARGDSAALFCEAMGIPQPNITWYKGDQALDELTMVQMSGGELYILTIEEQDEGDYTCVATNDAGSDRAVMRLKVGVPPTSALPFYSVGIGIHENGSLPCGIVGNPIPRIEWSHEDGRPINHDRYKILQDGSLFVQSAARKDEGLYICKGKNPLGEWEVMAQLAITGIVLPKIRTYTSSLVVHKGHTAVLTCTIIEGTPPPTLTWLKGLGILTETDSIKMDAHGNLMIENIQAEDAGDYTCVASNVGGNITHTMTISVQVPPKIEENEDGAKIIVTLGDPVMIDCHVTGDPRPLLSWTKNSQRISVTDPHYLIAADGSLNIFSVDPQDTAVYSCTALNVAGIATKRVNLFVQVPPTINRDEDEYSVVNGDDIVIPCEVTAIPAAIITWKKDGQLIPNVTQFKVLSNGGLEILDANIRNQGLYECIASNKAGNSTKVVSLLVHVPPSITGVTDGDDPLEQTIISGKPVILECITFGDPPPKIRWQRDRVNIDPFDPRNVDFIFQDDGSLYIHNVQVDHAARYTCIAENDAGSATKEIQLIVHVVPYLPRGLSNSTSTVEKQRATLACPAKGTPKPDILWYKDGEVLTGAEPEIAIHTDGTLEFLVPEAKDAGIYKCLAVNAAGNKSRIVEFKVYVPPKLKDVEKGKDPRIPLNPNVIIKHSTILTCPVYAIPPPQITWYKNGRPMNFLSEKNAKIFDEGRELEIFNASRRARGRYTCIARNIAGETEKNFDLDVHEPPEIDADASSNNNLRVTVNRPLIIDCRVSGHPDPKITWYKDGTKIDPKSPNVRMFARGRRLELSIAKVNDTGLYICEAVNAAGKTSRNYTLEVQVPPKITGDESGVTTPSVVENNTIIFDCSVAGKPKPLVEWFKGDELITKNTSKILIIDHGHRLKIRFTAPTDSARYSCEAQNVAGRSKKYFDLSVLVPPEIDVGSTNTNPSVVIGRSTIISCPAVGVPPPTITWHRNHKVLEVEGNENLRLLAGGRQLRVINARIENSGLYTCKVSNTAGDDSLDFSLNVMVPPKINSYQISLVDIEVVVNRSIVIKCPATGIPAPDITWYKEGRPLDVSRPNIALQKNGQELQFKRVAVRDTGRYTCRAVNEAGSAEQDYRLSVLVPPHVDDTYLNRTPDVNANDSIVLYCPIKGTPEPQIQWLRNGIPLESGQHVRIHGEGTQLEIFKARTTDSARYTCIATNKAGTSDLDFDLDVLVPPYLDGNNVDLFPKVIKGRLMILNCPAMGIPFPNITWYKADDPITLSDPRFNALAQGRQLEILNTMIEDSGKYRCIARNRAGNVKLDFNMQVIVPPTIDDANIVDNPRVIMNRTVILECPVAGVPPPKVRWLKDGYSLVSKGGLVIDVVGKQVAIAHSKVTDSGRYTCIASNDAGELSRTFDLEVLVPPSIDDRNLNFNPRVIQNRSIYIECPASSSPPPSFIWLKNKIPMQDLPSANLKLLNSGRQLHVSNAQISEAALYTCMATNVAGYVERSFKLEVLIPPTLIEGNKREDISVVRGRIIKIKCLVTGVPKPLVTWYRDGAPLLLDSNPHMQVTQDSQVLEVLSAHVEDRSQYACRAHNPAGEVEKYFSLDVFVPPKINGSGKLEEFSVIQNRNLVLDCPASGIPTPTIQWYHSDDRLSVLSSPNLRFINSGQQLHIVGAHLLNIGRYRCQASNPAGNVSKQFIVGVLVPPSIEEDGPTLVQATINSRTLLLCDAIGIPDPDVRWEKDGEPFATQGPRHRMLGSGSLEFSSVRLDDTAMYQCTAQNEAGEVSRNIRLDVQIPPKIQSPTPLEMQVTVDDSISLPCQTTGIPRPRITWQKGTIVLNSVPRYAVAPSGSLEVQNVQLEDGDTYICIAQNNAGTAMGRVKLKVLIPPKIEKQKTEYIQVSGREIIIPCRATGSPQPKLTWKKDGEPIPPNDFRYRLLRSGWLAIPLTRTLDSGVYTCIAENNGGQDSLDMSLIIQVPPHIEETQRIFTITQGDQAVLPCKAQGVPNPKMAWYRKGLEIRLDDPRYELIEDGSLQLDDVQSLDGGSYVCTATNNAGRDSQQIILRVQVPPTFTRLPQDQEVTANGRIELECAASGLPVPVITWKINNTVIPSPPSINGRSRLIIENARKEDGGTYVCTAENPAGLRKVISAVFVKVPPRVLIPYDQLAVTKAQQVILNCPVSGDPVLSILWTKNGREVILNNRIHQLGNGSLVIYDSVNSDAGEYKCVASNEAGTSEGSATLTIRSQPEFTLEPDDQVVAEGDTTIMNCAVKGEPKPSLRWQKGRQKLVSEDRLTILSNHSLRIVATKQSDAGIYLCIARNYLGSVLVQAELTVKVNGGWSDWTDWEPCSLTCGTGFKRRTRHCDNPAPKNGGKHCIGKAVEQQTCSLAICAVDGKWTDWTPWEECSKTCGNGERIRSRKCQNPPPSNGGQPCHGESVERVICNIKPCPVHGDWGEWSNWRPCSESCGQGTQERYRRCDRPRPQDGGRDCIGKDLERRTCIVRHCEVHGNWGNWNQWSSCSQSCGGGKRERKRLCDNPAPSDGGRSCPGLNAQIDYCNSDPCPVHGLWAQWAPWGACSVSCNGGKQKRFRTCSNPSPAHGGRVCPGSNQISRACNQQKCPENGYWNEWGQWSMCSKKCGSGTRERKRVCIEPKHLGRPCYGDSSQIGRCNVHECIYGAPKVALGNVIGNINDKDFGISKLTANVTKTGPSVKIIADIINIPKHIGPLMRPLISILSPVYWTTAKEIGDALNGFSLTKGIFKRDMQVEFATGEILRVTHLAQGLDQDGRLKLDILVNGNVPVIANTAEVGVQPYTENYLQTGAGSLFAKSSRTFSIDGFLLPYAWNHTTLYDSAQGKMPYLVEQLSTDDIDVHFDIDQEILKYQLTATISQGIPSNQCSQGFILDPSGPYCEDNDECLRNPCSHFCHNMPGSFSCSCRFGYTLKSDGKTCKDIDECRLGTARCGENNICVNTDGAYKCVVNCGKGFRRLRGGHACQDINECRETPQVCDHHCRNRIGSYRCSCYRGYRLVGQKTCEDVDECSTGRAHCSHACENTPGSFRCTCPKGFVLINKQRCRDVDECRRGTHNCGVNQECRNLEGSFQCIQNCPVGMKRAKNSTCIDIDECALNRNQCFYNQICVNTHGSYHCKCPPGYRSSGAGQPCTDIDECKETPSPCAYKCRNFWGSYLCICPPYQKLLADGRSCAGIEYLGPERVHHSTARRGGDQYQQTNDRYGYDQNYRWRSRRSLLGFIGRRQRPCITGYYLKHGECIDYDECQQKQLCQHECVNIPGSYQCMCPQGYRLSDNKRTCTDIDECTEMQIDCGPNSRCFNRRGDFECIDVSCPLGYEKDINTGHCVLDCQKSNNGCPSNARFADILEFQAIALPNGIPAYQDLIRLVAYNQFGEQLKKTTFVIIENDVDIPFTIRISDGKGIVFTLKPLQDNHTYRIKVRAQSFDGANSELQYQITFILHIAVSAYPY